MVRLMPSRQDLLRRAEQSRPKHKGLTTFDKMAIAVGTVFVAAFIYCMVRSGKQVIPNTSTPATKHLHQHRRSSDWRGFDFFWW